MAYRNAKTQTLTATTTAQKVDRAIGGVQAPEGYILSGYRVKYYGSGTVRIKEKGFNDDLPTFTTMVTNLDSDIVLTTANQVDGNTNTMDDIYYVADSGSQTVYFNWTYKSRAGA